MNKIENIDCLIGLKSIPDNSIDLVLTSPPYDNLRKYNGYSFLFEDIAKELYRVTAEGGVVVWVVGDATIQGTETASSFKQALFFKEIGFHLHDTMIWQKSRPLPQNQHPRYTPSFEYMFVFSKGTPKTFNPLMVPSKHAGKVTTTNGQRNRDGSFRHDKKVIQVNDFKRMTNIWCIAQEKTNGINHPAVFPAELASNHILSWSNEGDVVLDPFLGSGTTCIAAKELNRQYIGFEISHEYYEIAKKRLGE